MGKGLDAYDRYSGLLKHCLSQPGVTDEDREKFRARGVLVRQNIAEFEAILEELRSGA